MMKLQLFTVLFIVKCGILCLVQSQILQISARFSSGNVIFTWTPSYYSMYNVLLTRDTSSNDSALVNNTQYTVRDVLLYDSITISVKSIGSPVDNRMTYNVSKIKTKLGDTVNISWTSAVSPVFAFFGEYNVYQTYRENRTIITVSRNGVRYGGKTTSLKYTILTLPFDSPYIMFVIRNITLDDAGYYKDGITAEAAWSDGGVVLVVNDKPLKPNITGNLEVEVNRNITLTCSSKSTSAPDYYSKLVTMSYNWFVNDKRISGETRESLKLNVPRKFKYNRYSCTATQEDMESERSDPVQINPLYKPDRLTINPEPDQDEYNKTTVREGGTIGPFNCSADCNPPCNITWTLKSFGLFREHPLKDGLLLLQPVKREMELLQCVARWVYNDAQIKESIKLDVQYLDNCTFYINDVLNSNGKVWENAPLRISCHVDGNPAPTIRLSRGQADTELLERQGTWLNYTINTAQCTDTDTYRCSGTSTGFNNTKKVLNINVLCKTRFDNAQSFKFIYGSKSGMDINLNVAVPIIANPPPQEYDFTWNGPVPVSVRTTISRGDLTYKHVVQSDIPVKNRNYFGNYTLTYKGQKIARITIKAEDDNSKNLILESSEDKTSKTCIAAISLLSILLGLTWLIVALCVIYKRRYRNIHQNNKHGEESIKLEAQNMKQHYDDVQGTVEKGTYTGANGDYTAVEGDYTELGQLDPETPYEELRP